MSVMRRDLLPSNMTDAKEAQVRALLAAYRRGAVLLGREQWRLFFEAGRLDRNHDKDKASFAAVIGAANRVQMCRWQVVGQLQGWIGNRANEFRDTVTRSTLDPELRSSGDPRQAGRSPGSLRGHVRRGEPGLHVPDLLVLRLRGQAKSPIAEQLPVPVVRLNHARRRQCGTKHRTAPCAVYRFRVPVEGVSPR